jgi:hypothetical protein
LEELQDDMSCEEEPDFSTLLKTNEEEFGSSIPE